MPTSELFTKVKLEHKHARTHTHPRTHARLLHLQPVNVKKTNSGVKQNESKVYKVNAPQKTDDRLLVQEHSVQTNSLDESKGDKDPATAKKKSFGKSE